MTSGRRALLLEDDPNLGLVLQEHLQMQGFEVTLCVNGQQGAEAFESGSFDICLVDVMMPKKDGFTFAREVREIDQYIPIIFLTAKSLKEDRIEGFRIGCDDYITKPFSIEELQLRIKAVLRRTAPIANPDETKTEFEIGEYRLDCVRRLLVRADSQRKLTPKESELLRLLCLNMNQTLSRQEALREIWGNDNYFSGRSMDVFISKLRKYLSEDSRVEIMGVHGQGFRLVVG